MGGWSPTTTTKPTDVSVRDAARREARRAAEAAAQSAITNIIDTMIVKDKIQSTIFNTSQGWQLSGNGIITARHLDVTTLDIAGVVSGGGGGIFNEDGGAVDFRIETDNIAYAFHVDGSEDLVQFLGTLTEVDSAIWGDTFVRAGINMVLDGTADAGSANETVFQIQSTVPASVASTVAYEKTALFAEVLTLDVTVGAITRDIVAVGGRGYIGNGNTYGRAWGGSFIAGTAGTGDGYLCGLEIGVKNMAGTDQTATGETTTKNGLQIVNINAVDATAAILITNSSTGLWHKGIKINTGTLDTEASDSAFEVGAVWRVKPDGTTGIGTNAPGAMLDVRGDAIFNEDSADKDFRVESNGNANMLFVDGGADRVGIGTGTPAYKLEAYNSQSVGETTFGLYNPDTTDGNNLAIGWTTDTTGTGAASGQGLAAIRGVGTTHDHATRTGTIVLRTVYSGTWADRLTVGGGEIIVNDGSADTDFRVESDGNANAIFVDGGNNRVGIMDGAPGEVLDVTGNINATGVIKIDDVQVLTNRVVDARCDDVVNSGDATTDGVIDALRDAMITHGLIAAA